MWLSGGRFQVEDMVSRKPWDGSKPSVCVTQMNTDVGGKL